MSEEGGRVFFTNVRRSLEIEDEIRLTSVGVDIGSSTSHLVFSRLVLERLDNRYVVSERRVIHESEVLLTPYAGDATIDALALGASSTGNTSSPESIPTQSTRAPSSSRASPSGAATPGRSANCSPRRRENSFR